MPTSTAPALVSVVIPCFNQGVYLAEAIASVKSQQYSPIELIVVDDGSTDNTAEIAAAHASTLIRQRNRGLGAARNAGLARAAGPFVVFLDADDELLPEAIARGVATLSEAASIACVVRRCQVMDADRRPLPTTHPIVASDDLYREWLRRNFVWTAGAAMFRRSRLVDIGGFPEDLGPAADYAVYLTFARDRAVILQPFDVVRYRQHDQNMSRDPALMLRTTLEVLRRERHHVPSSYRQAFKEGVRSWRALYGTHIVERLRHEFRAGKHDAWQLNALWTLLRHCPSVMAAHATRKLSRIVRGLPPAAIEDGRFGPAMSRSRSRPQL